MKRIFICVDAPHYSAAFEVTGDVVTRAAPIIRWMIGKNVFKVVEYLKKKDYTLYISEIGE